MRSQSSRRKFLASAITAMALLLIIEIRFVRVGVSEPLHRCGIGAHRRVADNLWIARHAREAVALRIFIDDSCGLRNVIRSCGHCPSNFVLCRVTDRCRSLWDVFDSARLTNLISIIRGRAMAVMALAKNLRLELWDLISELLSLLALRHAAGDPLSAGEFRQPS